jgi:site-specific recombinase XerD
MAKRINHPIIDEFEAYISTKNLSSSTLECIYLPVIKNLIAKLSNDTETHFTKEHFTSTLSDYSYDIRREKTAIHVLKVFTKFIYVMGRISEDSEIISFFYKEIEEIKKPIRKINRINNSQLENILKEYKFFLIKNYENQIKVEVYTNTIKKLLALKNENIENLKECDIEKFINSNYGNRRTLAHRHLSLFVEFLKDTQYKDECVSIIKKYYIPPKLSIPEVDDFLRYFRSCGKAESTAYGYGIFLIKFFESLNESKRNNLKLINTQDVERFLVSNKEITVLSLNAIKSALKSFFSYCQKKDWICDDLITDTLTLKKPPKRNKAIFSNQEIHKIYDALSKSESNEKDTHYTMFSILYQFGLRVSSLVILKVSGIEIDNKRIKYFDTKSKTWAYAYPPNNGIMKLLEDYITEKKLTDPDAYVFTDSKGQTLSSANVREIIYCYYDKAGIQEKYKLNKINKNKYNVHSLRFHYITALCKAGNPETTVQRVIHHKNINNTGLYNIYQEDDIKKGIQNNPYAEMVHSYMNQNEGEQR